MTTPDASHPTQVDHLLTKAVVIDPVTTEPVYVRGLPAWTDYASRVLLAAGWELLDVRWTSELEETPEVAIRFWGDSDRANAAAGEAARMLQLCTAMASVPLPA